MKNKVFFQVSIAAFLISLLTVQFGEVSAQTVKTDSTKKSFRLFKDEKLLEITLRFDLSTYFRTKPQNNYLDANITINPGKPDSISKDIKLKTRGIFRNTYCMFAPIELNFKKIDFGYSDLNKISKLKLVPQCSSGRDKEDFVIREYLAYKLFNVLTDTSFRVRLLTINYIDSEKKKKPVVQYGFFIEPAEILASRTNCIQVKSRNLNQKSIIPRIMDRLAIFNFMIGNYDWSIPGLHNVVVLKSKIFDPTGLGIAIPYDFDWSGVVNPPYAVPTEEVGTDNVRERLFTGICRTREIYESELDYFFKKKPEFYQVINDFPYISEKSKKDIINYLDTFFDRIEGKKELIIYQLKNTCKNF